jgi:hypothetical protein
MFVCLLVLYQTFLWGRRKKWRTKKKTEQFEGGEEGENIKKVEEE